MDDLRINLQRKPYWASRKAQCRYAHELQRKPLEQCRDSLRPGPILLLLDCAPIHTSTEFSTSEKLQYLNIHMVYIPGGFTGKLQPLDLTANRAFKSRLRTAFTSSMARMLLDGLRKDEATKDYSRANELKRTLPTYVSPRSRLRGMAASPCPN